MKRTQVHCFVVFVFIVLLTFWFDNVLSMIIMLKEGKWLQQWESEREGRKKESDTRDVYLQTDQEKKMAKMEVNVPEMWVWGSRT